MTLRAAAALLACAVAAFGCTQDSAPRLPYAVRYQWLEMHGDRISYEITREGQIRRMQNLGKGPADQTKAIDPNAWREFDATLSALDVRHWLKEYNGVGYPSTNHEWTLTIRDSAGEVSSSGHSAGPSLTDPSQTVSIRDEVISADRQLDLAFDKLWSASR